MNIKPAILPHEERVIRALLKHHLPPGTDVYVFGSRATLAAKPYSDLDLSIEGRAPLPLATLAGLRQAFDESSLPWKVDLLDRFTASEAFGQLIDAQKVRFELD